MDYNIYIRASKKDLEKAGLGTHNSYFHFEGKVSVHFTTDAPPLSYKEEPIDNDEVIFYVSAVIDQYLDWHPPLSDILFGICNMKEAQKQNDMETFHEEEQILRSNDVIRFLRKICELDRFSIYIFEDDEVIDQRVEYTEDMDIFSLVIHALNYEAPRNIEIYRR